MPPSKRHFEMVRHQADVGPSNQSLNLSTRELSDVSESPAKFATSVKSIFFYRVSLRMLSRLNDDDCARLAPLIANCFESHQTTIARTSISIHRLRISETRAACLLSFTSFVVRPTI